MANKFSSSHVGPVSDVSTFGSNRVIPRDEDVSVDLGPRLDTASQQRLDITDNARAGRTNATDLKIPAPDILKAPPGTKFYGEDGGDYTKKAGYENAPSTNTVARDGGSTPQLNTTGAITGQDLSCNSERRAEYGKVQITETAGGHQIILNDTIGSESIMIRHSSGSGIELRPDGSLLISATNIVYNVQGRSNFVVEGSTTFKTDGNITFEAGGSIDMSAAGPINMNTTSDLNQTIGGRSTSIVNGGQSSTVVGPSNSIHLGPSTSNYLGGSTTNVKGNMKTRIQGDAGFHSSGEIGITGEGRTMISSPRVSITGGQLEVVGSSGTIGGEGIICYVKNLFAGETVKGKNGVFSGDVTSPRFTGDLVGAAARAGLAQTLVGNVDYNPPAKGDVNEDGTALPTSALIAARQSSTLNGVKKVKVDVGDFTRKAHDQSIATGLEGHSPEVTRSEIQTGKEAQTATTKPKAVVNDKNVGTRYV